jgi:hypothetical protein
MRTKTEVSEKAKNKLQNYKSAKTFADNCGLLGSGGVILDNG